MCGANLFIGNLDPEVDEKLLYDTFSAFGVIISTPKIMRDPETGQSKGFGFIGYDTFEASDASIAAMNGQFLAGRPISVSYALKKDSKIERHGTPAERLLAGNNPNLGLRRPNTMFAAAAPNSGGPPNAMMPPYGNMPPPPPGMMPQFGQFPPPPPPGYGMPMPPMMHQS